MAPVQAIKAMPIVNNVVVSQASHEITMPTVESAPQVQIQQTDQTTTESANAKTNNLSDDEF